MEYEIKPQNKLSLGLKELWQYRELLYMFVWRDIKVKYKQTVLGVLWAILQPFLMAVLFSLFLGKAIASYSELPIPYLAFTLSGLIMWTVFSSGLNSSGNSMVSNANIIKKIYFPRLVIPIAAVLTSAFDFLMALIVFAAVLIYNQIGVHWSMLFLLPLSLILTCLSTFGLGCLLAALTIKYRDFRYILPFFIQALLFLTPVIYPLKVNGSVAFKVLMSLNPMTAPIELFRSGLQGYAIADYSICMFSIASSCILFIVGLVYFRKTEHYFADLA